MRSSANGDSCKRETLFCACWAALSVFPTIRLTVLCCGLLIGSSNVLTAQSDETKSILVSQKQTPDSATGSSTTSSSQQDPLSSNNSLTPVPNLVSEPALSTRAQIDADTDLSYNDGGGLAILFDDEEIPFSMIVNGRIQTRYSLLSDASRFQNPSLNEFELERARLGFRGYAYEKYLRYDLSFDFDSDGGTGHSASLITAMSELRTDEALGIGWGDRLYLRAGFWRSNFGRQVAESSKRMQFVDRSLVASFFNIGSNTGIGVRGEFTYLYKPLRYEISFLNGLGVGNNTPRSGFDDQFALSYRSTFDLLGNYAAGEGDIRLSSVPTMRIGSSLAFTRRKRSGEEGSTDEFDASPANLMVEDIANNLPISFMDDLSGRERSYDLLLGGLEASYKHCGFSLHGEYFVRSIQNVEFLGTESFQDLTHGYYVQGGYFITEFVEVALRHGTLFAHGEGDGSPTGLPYTATANESAVGLNFYFRGDDSKLQFDVSKFDGAPLTSSSLNVRAGDSGWLLRAQYQLSF